MIRFGRPRNDVYFVLSLSSIGTFEWESLGGDGRSDGRLFATRTTAQNFATVNECPRQFEKKAPCLRYVAIMDVRWEKFMNHHHVRNYHCRGYKSARNYHFSIIKPTNIYIRIVRTAWIDLCIHEQWLYTRWPSQTSFGWEQKAQPL